MQRSSILKRNRTKQAITFRDLEASQVATWLAAEIYRLTRNLGPREETQRDGLRGTADAIPVMIARGQGGLCPRENDHNISAARVALAELDAHLMICERLATISTRELGMLRQMVRYLESYCWVGCAVGSDIGRGDMPTMVGS